MISLGSQRHSEIAHTNEMLQRMDTDSLGSPGQEGKEGKLPLQYNQWEHMELCLRMDDQPAERLQVGIRGQTNMDDVVVDVCYRRSD